MEFGVWERGVGCKFRVWGEPTRLGLGLGCGGWGWTCEWRCWGAMYESPVSGGLCHSFSHWNLPLWVGSSVHALSASEPRGSQLPHKSIKVSFTITDIKNQLTELCENLRVPRVRGFVPLFLPLEPAQASPSIEGEE